jgi:ABC-2 type transport system permease protein
VTSYATTTPADIGNLGAGAALRAVGNEVYKGLLAGWSERTQILIEMPLFVISALLIAAIVGRGEEIATGQVDWSLDKRQATWFFLGFAAFSFYYLQTAKLFWRLLGEIQTGTLEQVYLSPLPPWLIAIAGRTAAAVLETAFVVGAVTVALWAVVGLEVQWNAWVVVPVIFIVAGGTGYSLIIGGLALVWRRIELIPDAAAALLMVFGGLFIPLADLPSAAGAVARLVPLTHAAEALRYVLLDGRSVTSVGGDGGLAWLVGTTAAWLLGGILVFRFGERTAKRHGSLSRY